MMYTSSKECIQLLYIRDLAVDERILYKLEARHAVRFEEVEQVCYSQQSQARSTREGLYQIFGRTLADGISW